MNKYDYINYCYAGQVCDDGLQNPRRSWLLVSLPNEETVKLSNINVYIKSNGHYDLRVRFVLVGEQRSAPVHKIG